MNRALLAWLMLGALLVGCARPRCCARRTNDFACGNPASCLTDGFSNSQFDSTQPSWPEQPQLVIRELAFPTTGTQYPTTILPIDLNQPHEAFSDDAAQRTAAALVGSEVILQAAQRSPVGEAIRLQRERIADCDADSCQHQQWDEILSSAEARERQLSAVAAAELIVQIGRLQGQQLLILEARENIDQYLTTLQGFAEVTPERPDDTQLKDRRLELDEQQARLESGFAQAQSSLKQLLGQAPQDLQAVRVVNIPTWPELPLEEELVELAWDQRPDLEMTIALGQVDSEQFDLSGSLAAIHPVLALRLATRSDSGLLANLFEREDPNTASCDPTYDAFAAAGEQRRQIAKEVISAAAMVNEQQLLFSSARQRLALWQQRIDELQRLGELRSIPPADWFAARLNLIDAQSKLLDAAAECELTRIRLESALGRIDVERASSAVPFNESLSQ